MEPSNDLSFHECSHFVMNEVLDCVSACVPAGWMSATLELKVTGCPGFGPPGIQHRLTNPENGEEVVDFTGDLFTSTSKLHSVCREFGENWNQCLVTMKLDGTGTIYRATIRYNYP